jgi:hypothetical protein
MKKAYAETRGDGIGFSMHAGRQRNIEDAFRSSHRLGWPAVDVTK